MSRRDREFDDELRHHQESLEAEYRQRGLSPEEARFAALRDLGGITRTKELYRDQYRWAWLDTAWRDLRYALRSIRRTPALATAVILTLALGIGANTAIFSLVRVVLLKPLPFHEPDRLVWATEYDSKIEIEGIPSLDAQRWIEQNRSFQRLASVAAMDTVLRHGESSRSVRTLYSSAPLLQLLGIAPVLGRDFLSEELTPPTLRPKECVALVSQRLFQDEFAGDPQVLGQTVDVHGALCTVIGVTGPNFQLPLGASRGPQVDPDVLWNGNYNARGHLIGRLKSGVGIDAAGSDLAALRTDRTREFRLETLRQRVGAPTRADLWILWLAVSCVLLIACVNVANLLLARSTTRAKELAVRAALGAGRGALLRHTLVETLLLAFAGGALALLLVWASVEAFAEFGPTALPRIKEIRLDWAVAVYGAACCILSGLVCGLPAGFDAMRSSVLGILRRGGEQTSSASLSIRLWHASLAVSQIALAFLLLTGAGLLIRSLWTIRSASVDAQPEHVLVARVEPIDRLARMGPDIATSRRSQQERTNLFLHELRSRPGISSASLEVSGSTGSGWRIAELAWPLQLPAQLAGSDVELTYFQTAGHRLLAGRLFSDSDAEGHPRVVIVNASFAKAVAPHLPPSILVRDELQREVQGKRLPGPSIVGIVSDLSSRRNALPEPQLFFPQPQSPNPAYAYNLYVRAAGNPLQHDAAIRRIAAQHRQRLIGPSESLEERLTAAVATRTFESRLLSSFASLALLLAIVGIYGVLNYAVAQETREIGIRIALGADRSRIHMRALARGLRFAALGIAGGLAASLGAGRIIQSLLFGITPLDPLTYFTAAAILLTAALLAAYLPARRAAQVDPMTALRHE